MQPRLKTSSQWTPFPEELCQLCAQVLTERFFDEYDLDKAKFVVEGRIFANEIVGRFGLNVENQLKQPNFEVSFDFNPETEKALEMIQKSMDVVEHLWTELLEDDFEDAELAVVWQSLPFDKKDYHYRYSTVNSDLEKEADLLLQEFEKQLVYGESELEESEPLQTETEEKTLH